MIWGMMKKSARSVSSQVNDIVVGGKPLVTNGEWGSPTGSTN